MAEVVHALWVGENKMGPLEMLTMNSFVRHGCEFNLWHYCPIISKIPDGVVLRDGRDVVPEKDIFCYPKNMMLGFGGGSHVGFSEIFRYKVLYDHGGWWSDMDVTCLKPLSLIDSEYFFRNHGVLSVVGNIMKAPKGSELMRLCHERALVEVNSRQTDWHHAIRILCYYIEFLGLSGHIRTDACNLDRQDYVWPLAHECGTLSQIPSSWRFIHWMNSVFNKAYKKDSVFDRLLELNGCAEKPMFI